MPIVGQDARVKITTKSGDTLTDPTSMVIRVSVPAAGGKRTVTTYTMGVSAEIVASSTGIYYLTFPTSRVGEHYVSATTVISGSTRVDETTVPVDRSKID